MKKTLIATVVVLASCGGGEVETVQTQPVNIPVVAPAPVQMNPMTDEPIKQPITTKPVTTPPPQKPAAETGSTNIEPVLLSQLMLPQGPTVLMGTATENTINLEIKEPPPEISPCYGALMTYNVPVVDKQYQYNGWWLLALLNYPNPTTNFYWATQISNTQVGAVPTGYNTNLITNPPQNVQIDLGYAKLPYQWSSHAGLYSGFPVNPNEKCTG